MYVIQTFTHTHTKVYVQYRLRIFENRVLRRIFGPKGDEVTGEWIRLNNKEFYALYSSPNVIQVIKSRKLRCAGHVARMGARCTLGSIDKT
jgi:hypothetical protein